MRKIVLISPKDYNFYNFRSELILELKKKGNEVVLICPYGKKIDYFTDRGCRFVNIEVDRRGKNIKNDLKLIFDYKKILTKENPDVVLTYTSKPSIYAGFVCGIMGIPYIVNNAGLMKTYGLFDKFMKFLYWVGFRKASCIMFQNTQERDTIDNLLSHNVHFRDIPGSGVNLNEFCFSPYPNEENGIVFNYVGRIVALKGIDEYLECAKRIKKRYPNTIFRIYGDFDDDSYNIRIKELQEQGIVDYCGVKLDMKPAIREAHAVIHPSHYEGMTNVVLEHSAIGRICIGSDIPGVKDGIDDGKTGFVFKVNDVNSLVNAVIKFLNLTHIQKIRMASDARKKMEREFNREIVTNVYIEEIDRINMR